MKISILLIVVALDCIIWSSNLSATHGSCALSSYTEALQQILGSMYNAFSLHYLIPSKRYALFSLASIGILLVGSYSVISASIPQQNSSPKSQNTITPNFTWQKSPKNNLPPKTLAQPRNFSWIDDEQKIGGMQRPTQSEQIEALKQKNVGTIITLTETPLEAELQDPAITYQHIPVQDFCPPTIEQINTAMQAIDDAHQKGKAAVVHCRAGIGRTGTMLACWLVKQQNLTADQTIAKIRNC